MDWKSKKKPLMGVVGGLGVAAFLLGAIGAGPLRAGRRGPKPAA
jgi:hypothetical protein